MPSYADVRREIDGALERSSGVTAAAAYEHLSPVGRVVWMLDELRVAMTGGMHIHSQQFMTGDLDGPVLIARLAEAVRPLDGEVADFCRWVAERGSAHRQAAHNEPFSSVVNLVGAIVEPRFERLLASVAAEWASDLVLESLPDPSAWRRLREPADAVPHFPDVTIAIPLDRGRDHVLCVVAHALWRAGASDETLDRAILEIVEAKSRMPELIATWGDLDGDGATPERLEAVRAALFPAHPLEAIIGHALDSFLGIVRIDPERFADTAAALEPAGFRICVADEGTSAARSIRAALRTDPDGVVVRAEDLPAPDDTELLLQVAFTGHVIVVSGSTPALEATLASDVASAIQVYDRRARTE